MLTRLASRNSAKRIYGFAFQALAGSITGAVNGDTFTWNFSITAAITSNAGAYNNVSTAAGANLADHAVTAQNCTLTITQAGSTISLNVRAGSITPEQSVTLTAAVLSPTTGTPTGSVNFYDGTTLLDTETAPGVMASFITSALSG